MKSVHNKLTKDYNNLKADYHVAHTNCLKEKLECDRLKTESAIMRAKLQSFEEEERLRRKRDRMEEERLEEERRIKRRVRIKAEEKEKIRMEKNIE